MTSEYIECPEGHKNPSDANFCSVCGVCLPKKMRFPAKPQPLNSLKEPSKRFFIVSVGEAGCNVLVNIHQDNALSKTEIKLFALDTSSHLDSKLSEILGDNSVEWVGAGLRGLGHDWKLVESAAKSDPRIVEPLLTEERIEALMIVAAVGGGVEAGVGPYFLSSAYKAEMKSDKVAIPILPSDQEPGIFQFNAISSLAKFISYNRRRNADILIPVSAFSLAILKSVGKNGVELTPSQTVASLIAFLLPRQGEQECKRLDLEEIVHIAKTTGILHYVPCLALNHSFRIYGSLMNIFQSALLRPLMNIRPETALCTFMLLRIPSALKGELKVENITSESLQFREESFPNEIEGDCGVCFYESSSDKVDLLLLLGGCDLNDSLAPLLEGYHRIKDETIYHAQVAPFAQRDMQTVTKAELDELEDVLNSYNAFLKSKRLGLTLEKH